MPEPSDLVPVVALTLTIDLPESATPEQREAFHRALKELGGSSTHVVQICLPASVPKERRDAFAAEYLRLSEELQRAD